MEEDTHTVEGTSWPSLFVRHLFKSTLWYHMVSIRYNLHVPAMVIMS